MPLVTDIKDVAFEEGFYKNAIERISQYTINDEKPDAVVMMWVNNLVPMIRVIKDDNSADYQEFADEQFRNYLQAMESILKYPLIAKGLQISDEVLCQIPLNIEQTKQQLQKKGEDGKRVNYIDKRILRSPLYFLQFYLLNVKKITPTEVDRFVLHIYIYTKYRYAELHPDNYEKHTAKLPNNDIRDELKAIRNERVELFERMKNDAFPYAI